MRHFFAPAAPLAFELLLGLRESSFVAGVSAGVFKLSSVQTEFVMMCEEVCCCDESIPYQSNALFMSLVVVFQDVRLLCICARYWFMTVKLCRFWIESSGLGDS